MEKAILDNKLSYYDGALIMTYSKDNEIYHYRLAGERFKHNNELLKIISKNDGICLEHAHYGTYTHCDFNCYTCDKSAYHLLQLKEKFFNQKCEIACSRIPKQGDQWEISMVMEKHFPYHYLDFHFIAMRDFQEYNLSIMDLCIMALEHIDADVYNKTHFCYIKVKRFDDVKALDVSIVANKHIKEYFHIK